MNKTTMFGKLLSRIANARYHTRQLAQLELWKRHDLGNPTRRDGYKMEEVAGHRNHRIQTIQTKSA